MLFSISIIFASYLENFTDRSNIKQTFIVPARQEDAYRMPERTLWIQAITIQPEPAIPRVHPGMFTMAILTFTSLITRGKSRSIR